jgi:uroporphyrinogen III methyltransferase/synthase
VEALDRSTADLRAIRARLCAIGPATRDALSVLHLKCDLMGAEYVAEGLVEAFAPYDLTGKRILLPRAAVARDLVPVELGKRGAQVDVVEAYRTVAPDDLPARIREAFARRPDAITFTSSSTVQNFAAAAAPGILEGVSVISIGPITTATAKSLGIDVAKQAHPYTIEGLVEAIVV